MGACPNWIKKKKNLYHLHVIAHFPDFLYTHSTTDCKCILVYHYIMCRCHNNIISYIDKVSTNIFQLQKEQIDYWVTRNRTTLPFSHLLWSVPNLPTGISSTFDGSDWNGVHSLDLNEMKFLKRSDPCFSLEKILEYQGENSKKKTHCTSH